MKKETKMIKCEWFECVSDELLKTVKSALMLEFKVECEQMGERYLVEIYKKGTKTDMKMDHYIKSESFDGVTYGMIEMVKNALMLGLTVKCDKYSNMYMVSLYK